MGKGFIKLNISNRPIGRTTLEWTNALIAEANSGDGEVKRLVISEKQSNLIFRSGKHVWTKFRGIPIIVEG